MIRLFSTYFPKRTLFLAVCQILLVLALLPTVILAHRGTDLAGALRDGQEILRVMIIGLICLSCLYYRDVCSLGQISEPGPILISLIQALGVSSILFRHSLRRISED